MPIHDHAHFATTRWSLIQAAGREEPQARAALEELCQQYWFPVYAHVRRKGKQADDAEDLTQEFFARIIGGGLVEAADQDRGRFRSFLLTALNRFLVNEYHRDQTVKRGGDHRHISIDRTSAEQRYAVEPTDSRTPEQEFESAWARVMLQSVYSRLEAEQRAAGRGDQFEVLREFLPGRGQSTYAELGSQLRMSESAVKVAIHRLRRKFGELLREEVAQTVDSVDEIDDEVLRLRESLSRD